MANDMIHEILERIVRIETKIDGYNQLRERVDKSLNLSINANENIREVKESLKWVWRTIAAALISGSIGFFFYMFQNGAIK